jgi:hypothetical protein
MRLLVSSVIILNRKILKTRDLKRRGEKEIEK